MKILLADDHVLVREGLKATLASLAPQVHFVDAWDSASVWQQADSHRDLDLALIDLGMPGMTGAGGIARLRADFPMLPVIVLSGAETRSDAEASLQAGASGFIPKSASADITLSAIRLVLAGGVYLPPLLLHGAPDPHPPALDEGHVDTIRPEVLLENLSQRQREVLALLAEGRSNKSIARALDVTDGTVKTHLAQIFRVLNVHNRVAAVVAASRLRSALEKHEKGK